MDKPARLPPDTARGVVRRCDGLGQPDAAFGAVGELVRGCAWSCPGRARSLPCSCSARSGRLASVRSPTGCGKDL